MIRQRFSDSRAIVWSSRRNDASVGKVGLVKLKVVTNQQATERVTKEVDLIVLIKACIHEAIEALSGRREAQRVVGKLVSLKAAFLKFLSRYCMINAGIYRP